MSLKSFRAVLIGAPGSGKGTISAKLIEKFKLNYIASGDILRQNIENKTDFGNDIKSYIHKGKLVPDNLMISCITDEIKKTGDVCKWLLDGFPRTVNQAEKLSEIIKLDTVLLVNVPYNIIIERIQGRWIHIPSGRVYNIGFNSPRVPFKDDITGEPLTQREDDKLEAVQKRLELYENATKPVIEYYKNKNILQEFNGTESNEIFISIQKYIEDKFIDKK